MATAWEHIYLRNFSEAELIFDEQETKDILKFFFQADHQKIDSSQITNELRNFAQGLLVAAVDSSYAMGWVHLSFQWAFNPGAGLKKALQKLARLAFQHWFKHLKLHHSLKDIKIYDSIRNTLAKSFKFVLTDIIEAKAQGTRKQPLIACIDCAPPKRHDKVWG